MRRSYRPMSGDGGQKVQKVGCVHRSFCIALMQTPNFASCARAKRGRVLLMISFSVACAARRGSAGRGVQVIGAVDLGNRSASHAENFSDWGAFKLVARSATAAD